MKKIFLILLSTMLCFFIGCENPAANANDDEKPVDTLELKLALYNKILGTWENINEFDDDYIRGEREWEDYYCVIFSSNSITFDGDVHSFIPSKETLLLEEEVPEEYRLYRKTLYFYISGKYYSVIIKDDNNISISYPFVFYDGTYNAKPLAYIRKSNTTPDLPGGDLNFSVVGDWSYKINGSTNTTLKIKDNNTFSFSTIANSYSGTYSLSGNKITFDFDQNASMNIKDTFTITGSEDSITLTLVESVSTYNGSPSTSTSLSGMLNAFYGIVTSTSVTLNK